MVQWLRFLLSEAGDMGSIPGQRAKIPHESESVSCSVMSDSF